MTEITYEYIRRIMQSDAIVDQGTWRRIVSFMQVDAERYRWEREHPAWETEAFLSNLSPIEYDAAVDRKMNE